MEFVDRKSTYPNRYTMTDEAGNVSTVFLERADDPVVEGTPLNAKTFNSLLLASESENNPGCYYITTDGEPEWINPPMVPNVGAYRTIKRFNGYPVYTIPVVFSSLAEKGSFVHMNLTGATIAKVVSFNTTYYPKEDYLLSVRNDPFVDTNGEIAAITKIDANEMDQAVYIHSLGDGAKYYSAVCIIEFTKAEEAL